MVLRHRRTSAVAAVLTVMDKHRWSPRTPRATGLVAPVRVSRDGRSGPTRQQARGPHWRQTSSGMYVPSGVDSSGVEQRILEQGSRISVHGAVTAWASLRWRGATFFSGSDGPGELPVPLVVCTGLLRPDPRVSISFEQIGAHERELVDGLWVTISPRALLDEIRRHARLTQAVIDVEMAAAAGLVTPDGFRAYLETRNGWTGIGGAREAAAIAGFGCRSPQEVRMVLCWIWDAGLPRPLCNVPVFDLCGRLVAIVDLLDPVAGCVGEYQGEDHKSSQRHRADVARHEKLRAVGLEMFEVVGGDLADDDLVVKRMHAARERSSYLGVGERRWTLDTPDWWQPWARAHGWL